MDVEGRLDQNMVNVAPKVEVQEVQDPELEKEFRRLERSSRIVMQDLAARVERDQNMRASYKKLFSFLFALGVILGAVAIQTGTLQDGNQGIYQALVDQLFSVDSGTMEPDGKVVEFVTSKDDILSWFEDNILTTIFEEPSCGDDVCVAPEEFPYFQPSSEVEGRTFDGCAADCGKAQTTPVTIDFFGNP